MRLIRAQKLAPVAGPVLADAISRTVEARGRCRLALSGGSTPEPTFAWLRAHLPASLYPALWVTWVDERSDGSNRALADRAWLEGMPLGRVLPLFVHPELEASRAAAAKAFQEWGGVDVVQLGVGPDGHIASLFPGHAGLLDPGPIVAVRDSPKPPPERLSLALPVLEAAAHVVLLATGSDKAAVLGRAWRRDPDLPLGRLAPRGETTWICDEAAASELPEA